MEVRGLISTVLPNSSGNMIIDRDPQGSLVIKHFKSFRCRDNGDAIISRIPDRDAAQRRRIVEGHDGWRLVIVQDSCADDVHPLHDRGVYGDF